MKRIFRMTMVLLMVSALLISLSSIAVAITEEGQTAYEAYCAACEANGETPESVEDWLMNHPEYEDWYEGGEEESGGGSTETPAPGGEEEEMNGGSESGSGEGGTGGGSESGSGEGGIGGGSESGSGEGGTGGGSESGSGEGGTGGGSESGSGEGGIGGGSESGSGSGGTGGGSASNPVKTIYLTASNSTIKKGGFFGTSYSSSSTYTDGSGQTHSVVIAYEYALYNGNGNRVAVSTATNTPGSYTVAIENVRVLDANDFTVDYTGNFIINTRNGSLTVLYADGTSPNGTGTGTGYGAGGTGSGNGSTTTSAKTGDDNNLGIWTAVFGVSAVTVVGTVIVKRRKEV